MSKNVNVVGHFSCRKQNTKRCQDAKFVVTVDVGGCHQKPFLQWRHNEHDGISNHQPQDCLLQRLFRRRSKKTSKLGVTGLCAGNSPVTDEFPAQRPSNAENASIWWRHHVRFAAFCCIVCWLLWIISLKLTLMALWPVWQIRKYG